MFNFFEPFTILCVCSVLLLSIGVAILIKSMKQKNKKQMILSFIHSHAHLCGSGGCSVFINAVIQSSILQRRSDVPN
ncbi:MAG: hypothetical protein WDA00_04150 [Eubacteriales bacterium]